MDAIEAQDAGVASPPTAEEVASGDAVRNLLASLLSRWAAELGASRAALFLTRQGSLLRSVRVGHLHATAAPGPSPPVGEPGDEVDCGDGVCLVEEAVRCGRAVRGGVSQAPPDDRCGHVAAGSVLAVPVGAAPGVLGVVLLEAGPEHAFDDADLARAEEAVAEVEVVVELARVAEESLDRAREADAARMLLAEGSSADSIDAAARALATVARDALASDHVTIYLGSVADAKITHVDGVGVDPAYLALLRDYCVGRDPDEFEIWRATLRVAEPYFVEDARESDLLPADLVESLKLGSYSVLPLMSRSGPLGLVVCSHPKRSRHWSPIDRRIAEQLARQGSLVVENALLREAERRRVDELTYQAYHDPLTHLPNRAALFERLAQECARAERVGASFALLLLDVDDFKGINDTFGHFHGDQALRGVARRLQEAVRASDVAARLGGDEFAVLLTTGVDELDAVVRRLHGGLSEPLTIVGDTIHPRVSIGVAVAPVDGTEPDELYRCADGRMYREKAARARV